MNLRLPWIACILGDIRARLGANGKPRQSDGAQVGRWGAIRRDPRSDQHHSSYDADPDDEAGGGLGKQ